MGALGAPPPRRRIPAAVYLVGANLFWSGNFIVGRLLAGAVPPMLLNALRWSVAACLLLPLLSLREGLRLRETLRSEWRVLFLLSLTGVVAFNGLVYTSLTMTTATRGALLNAVTPLVTAALAWLLMREPLRPRQALGILVSFLGVGEVVTGGDWLALLRQGVNLGDLLMLLSTVVWALYTIWGRQAMERITPLRATTFAVLLGLPPLWLLALGQLLGGASVRLTVVGIGAILYIGIFASVAAFLFWYLGVERVGVNRAAPYLNLLPVFTAALAIVLLGERVTMAEWIGGAMVIGGVLWGTGKRRPVRKPGEGGI